MWRFISNWLHRVGTLSPDSAVLVTYVLACVHSLFHFHSQMWVEGGIVPQFFHVCVVKGSSLRVEFFNKSFLNCCCLTSRTGISTFQVCVTVCVLKRNYLMNDCQKCVCSHHGDLFFNFDQYILNPSFLSLTGHLHQMWRLSPPDVTENGSPVGLLLKPSQLRSQLVMGALVLLDGGRGQRAHRRVDGVGHGGGVVRLRSQNGAELRLLLVHLVLLLCPLALWRRAEVCLQLC